MQHLCEIVYDPSLVCPHLIFSISYPMFHTRHRIRLYNWSVSAFATLLCWIRIGPPLVWLIWHGVRLEESINV